MKLSIGIVGLPNVGKSTLFKIITGKEVNIANYPFCTIDPNVGIVEVPDERLDKLAELSKSRKKIPAIVEFYDIAGLIRGAHQGAGLGNQFLSHIRETNAILVVLRCFINSEIIHSEGSVDPLRDLETINIELAMKDLETVNKRLSSLEKELKSGSKDAIKEKDILTKIKSLLSGNANIAEFADEPLIKNLGLLSAKKRIYLLNGSENDVSENLKNKLMGESVYVADLSNSKMGDLDKLIKMAYRALDLISFFTTGEDETRAWTIKNGAKAPEAAGVIHTDFENKFIKAEIVSFNELIKSGSWVASKNSGLVRLEGKEHALKDGDVVYFKHG